MMRSLRTLSERGAGEDVLKSTERAGVISATSDERDWWARPGVRYPTQQDQEKAIARGELVRVPAPNKYFTVPSYIRADEHLQYLRPSALKLLMEALQELDERINFSQRGIRFAVISLYRSEGDQGELTESTEWYRSVPANQSSHTAGAAFDISLRSHYLLNKTTDNLDTVNTWDSNKFPDYDPTAIEELGAILSEKAGQGLCNLVVENRIDGTAENDYAPTCLHVCVSPLYEERNVKEYGQH